MDDLSASAITGAINEYCLNARARHALKRSMVDGISQEAIAEELDVSVGTIKNDMRKWKPVVKRHL